MAGPFNPTVEDCFSDDENHLNNDPVLESFRRSPGGQANVAAKRSHPSDLGNEKSPPVEKVVNIDSRSDSGYSSNYAFSAAPSADSALSAFSSQSSPPTVPPTAPSLPPASPATIKRRPTISERRPTISDDRKNSSNNSPRKPLQRSGSVSTRKPRERRQTSETQSIDCTDPNCTACGPNATPSSRGRPSPLDSGLDVSYQQTFDVRSQRSDPAPYVLPHSPTYTRPAPYQQGPAVIQPASTRRRSSSTNRTTRPMSFHGGDPGAAYWAAAGLQGPLYSQDQRRPPPSASAHFSTMHHPSMAPYMPPQPPPQPNYYPQSVGHPMQTSPPYDGPAQRPTMHSRTSSNYNPRGRPLSYGPALVTQEPTVESMPSARYAAPPQSARPGRNTRTEPESESSESEYSEEEVEVNYRKARNDRAIMPPPPPPAPTKTPVQRRPSLRHAATTQPYNTDRRMSQSQTLVERPREPRESRSNRVSTAAPTRAPSKARPALIQQPKAQSAFESAQNARVYVENSESRRRQSYNGYEKQYQAEEKAQRRANRNSKIYMDEGNRSSKVYAEDGPRTSKMYSNGSNRNSKVYADGSNRNSRMYTEDAIVQPTVRRRQTDSDARQREQQIAMSRAAMDAEAYQRTMRGSNDPIVDKVHKAAKRASRVITGPSEVETSRSKGSDKASRVSVSNRTTMTNGGSGGEIRLRVDASAPLNLQFNGDMEGRTLQIQPLEDGMADIVIGNPGSEYRSERGSVMGGHRTPKAIMASSARRDAEEASQRSERSNHSRRESERRVLQRPRRREIEYNDFSD